MKLTTNPTLLRAETYLELCESAITFLCTPEDVIRRFVGLQAREPFLIDRSDISGRYAIDRFLNVLALLYKRKRREFEDAAPRVRGSHRIYFAKDRCAISATGNSNSAVQIPGTPWFVSSNNDSRRKKQILSELMHKMGFSWEYADMVSTYCVDRQAALPQPYEDVMRDVKRKIKEPGCSASTSLPRQPTLQQEGSQVNRSNQQHSGPSL
jgi:negative regulator of replication initiation